MLPIQFSKLDKVLKINEDKSIIVTKGTISNLISIKTADSTRFVSNVLISAEASGFTFTPSTMNIYLGDFSTNFRVRVIQLYSFKFKILY